MLGTIPTVVAGADITLNVSLVQSSGPFSLQGMTGATGFFPGALTSPIAATGAVVSADLGTMSFFIPKAQSLNLALGSELPFELVIDKPGARTIVQDGLTWNVNAEIFPGVY